MIYKFQSASNKINTLTQRKVLMKVIETEGTESEIWIQLAHILNQKSQVEIDKTIAHVNNVTKSLKGKVNIEREKAMIKLRN